MRNPKSEIRNPKEARSPKAEPVAGLGRRGTLFHPSFSIFAFSLLVLLAVVERVPAAAYAITSPKLRTADTGTPDNASTGGNYALRGDLKPATTDAMSEAPFAVIGNFQAVFPSIRPPVATNLSLGTPMNTPVSIPVAWILMYASDPDGETVFLTGVTSPAHGTAVFDDVALTYTPDTGYSGPDSFSYTVRDSWESWGRTASATVSVTVYPATQGPSIMSVSAVGGTVTVRAAGIPSECYQLQYTTDLGNPNWRDVSGSPVRTSSTGVCQMTDSPTAGSPIFYRVRYAVCPP